MQLTFICYNKSMLTSLFKIFFYTSLLLLTSCSKDKNITSVVDKNFVILGPISNADVKIYDTDKNKTYYTTKTQINSTHLTQLKYKQYGVGSFKVELRSKVAPLKWVYTEITNGVDIDKNDDGIVDAISTPLQGKLKLYSLAEDYNNSHVILNALTTIAALEYEQNRSVDKKTFFDNFAKELFVKSVDAKSGVDYRDIFAYIPNYTKNSVFKNPHLYENLKKYGVLDAILSNANVTKMLNKDSDGDSLSLWQEILHNSNPNLQDSDADGIDDAQEIALGLNPASSDTDCDNLSDADEINIYHTNPLKSDTDNDYFPDGVEVENGTDPLDSDENHNGIADGLDGDPLLKYEWYLKSLGNDVANTASVSTIVGNDLGIYDIYHWVTGEVNGTNIVVQVVDSGVQLIHEDLDVDKSLSYNAVNHSDDPSPTKALSDDPYSPLDIGHGTAVAGIIAGVANNGVGIRGVIPHGRIAGSNFLEDGTTEELEKTWYSLVNSDAILVSNNSWGASFLQDETYETILKLASTKLRGGKGRVFTFAAGNFRKDYGNADLSYLSNNPYAITVASLNHKDTYSQYSSPGSNILVSAYGGEYYYEAPTIMTTLLMGKSYYKSELIGTKGAITVDEDANRNYTYAMNGTSAATPMVSGIIALTLQACPDLTYRDIRWLIANTATKVDVNDTTWVKNSAGLWHSIDYGYGKINGRKMIEMCRSKYFEPLKPLESYSVEAPNINIPIPDNNRTVSYDINFPHDMKIEWVGLTVTTDHPFAGDLEIYLISPQGTKTTIMTLTETHFAAYKDGFRFSSVAFIDENAKGVWRVEIVDRLKKDSGTLNSLKLEIQGHKE